MSRLLRRLRKMLRRAKSLVAIGSIMFFLINGFHLTSISTTPSLAVKENIDIQQQAAASTQQFTITLQTHYVCGVETEKLQFHHQREMEDWLTEHGYRWKVLERNGGHYVLGREVSDDLSERCKETGYFGIDQDGVLTIFEGPPSDNKVIQTFFRIDTKKLESLLPQEEVETLIQGIRIESMEEYLGVLSTYSPFAEQ
ncbi:BofC C-terminal domain-containing protein [Caldalkalibacillus salinus]|uniref:BofC C-terminal domain-containing protein n=1 Tax=Caldalkalibacillus salinus TaxID=2803787 RepID=UPI0019227A28|nr:BofC C-terminal domain-containing protein [Caldalkalibacillus salinus]